MASGSVLIRKSYPGKEKPGSHKKIRGNFTASPNLFVNLKSILFCKNYYANIIYFLDSYKKQNVNTSFARSKKN